MVEERRKQTWSLRPATAADYNFLFDLHCQAIREYVEPIWGWQDDWQAEYFRRKFNPAAWQVIQVDGEDAGVLIVEERPEALFLSLIELLPRFQGQGTGTALIRQLQARAAALRRPLTLHVLRTNEPARRLYERLGFRVVEEMEHRRKMRFDPAGLRAGHTP